MTTAAEPVRDVRAAAADYIRRGWQVVPLAPRSKACVDEGWLRLIFKPDDFKPDDNIGIRSVGGLVDVDCDAPEVVACAAAFLPPTGAVYGRPNKPSAHWLYHAPIDKLIAYKDLCAVTEQATLIEVRVNHQSMAPPSQHPDGQILEWTKTLTEAAHVDPALLLHGVRLAATCGLVSRHYNPPGNRHDWGVALSGVLCQLGLTEDECAKIFKQAGEWAKDPEVRDRLNAVRSTFARPDDDPLKGRRALKEAMSKGKDFLASLHRVWGSVSSAFILDDKGEKILANHQENIRRAFDRLEVRLSYDAFDQKERVDWRGHHGPLDDAIRNRLWLDIDATFHFRPTADFFDVVLYDTAHQHEFHPVRQYLDALRWDGTPRIDAWLTAYGGAVDTPLTRDIGRIVFIAAVRRVRQPGCKFDELLILESPQGTLKSSAIRVLCPDESWFSDDLPLGVDAKQTIERTGGRWLIEASELQRHGMAHLDSLKASLSRQVDGPCRLAYARLPVSRPRQFITIGTTNRLTGYLLDATGNRRFWPVRVQRFELDALRHDRDQLWAEAADREARGASIRLDPALYDAAAREQEDRRQDDPWEDVIEDAIDAEPEPWHFIPVAVLWLALSNLGVSQRNNRDAARLATIMQRFGYTRKRKLRLPGQRPAGYWIREGIALPGELPLDAKDESDAR